MEVFGKQCEIIGVLYLECPEQVCIDNGWEVTTDDEWTPICLLWDRWINLADMEEHPENNNETDEEVIVEETIIEQE